MAKVHVLQVAVREVHPFKKGADEPGVVKVRGLEAHVLAREEIVEIGLKEG